jgi:transglutaminase-like putative cysteine protease
MARPRPMEGVTEYVERIVSYVRDQLQYEPGVTDVFSSADDMLKAGAGVCQDFSHLTIGVLRLAGVPARYVSGYLLPDTSSNGTGSRQQASHAWLEAKLPNTGWTGFDPTHGCRADSRHIRVAIGRDYDDATPIRGVFRSRGHSQQMTVELSVLPGQSQSQSQGSQSQQQ